MVVSLLRLFYSEKDISRLRGRVLWENGVGLGKLERKSLLLGGCLGFIWLGIGIGLQVNEFVLSGVFVGLLLGPFLLGFLLQLYLVEKKKKEKEKLVADFLLQAAIFPGETPVEKIIECLGKEKNLLGREFEKAFSEIRKGSSVEKALENLSGRNESNLVKRMVELFKLSYYSKAKMSGVFKEVAEDVMQTQGIVEERNATVIIQKYTVMLAGAVLVPAILGLLAGMIGGLDFSILGSLELGGEYSERKGIVESALLATQIYIAEYAIIAAVYLGQQEGKPKKALLYALCLLPVSFMSFYLAQGIF